MAKPSKSPYKWDAALSFAREDRPHAKALAERLKAQGLSVFYDDDHRAYLWGKNQEVFERIYGPESRYVIALISEHYLNREWTRFEFDTARREQIKRGTEVLLPVRLDGTRMLGLPDDRVYLSLKNLTIDDIATDFEKRLSETIDAPASKPERHAPSSTKQKAALLNGEARLALGMIVASPILLPLNLYKRLFPETNWSRQARLLARYGLVDKDDGALRPSRHATKAVLEDETEFKRFSDLWIEKLESLKDHTDIALFLATHYIRAARMDDAVEVLSDIANSGVYGHTNETYLRLLKQVAQERLIQRLKPATRVKMFHALAVCLTKAGDYETALERFDRVRKENLRLKDQYWLGQYYVNSGIAYYLSGDVAAAARAYQKAIRHGERNDDDTLISRALGNLTQVKLSEGQPEAAIALLERSISAKRKGKDRLGIAVANAQMGTIEAGRRNYRVAIKHFRDSEGIFAEFDAVYELTKTHFNLGKAHAALGHHGNACRSFRKAMRLAEAEGASDLRMVATQGFAESCHVLKRFADIEEAYKELLASTEATEHGESRISAYFGIGISQLWRGLGEVGRGNLRHALQLARKLHKPPWEFKCLVALASPTDRGVATPPLERLTRLALQEQTRENWEVAAKLWELTVGCFTEPTLLEKVEAAFASVAMCMERSGAKAEAKFSLLLKLYAWQRRANLCQSAITTLLKAEELAIAHKLTAGLGEVIDERGTCCHILGLRNDALALHKRAVRMARKHNLRGQLRISLNNLGETLLQVGKMKESLASFEESEKLSRSAGDLMNAIATAINRALAIEASGDQRRAGALFNRCCTEARGGGFWHENARSLLCLADLALRQGRLDDAAQRYRESLSVAKRHGLAELHMQAAVNYASLLNERGQPGKGMKLLSECEGNLGNHGTAYVNYYILAELCLATGDGCRARKNWELGKAAALAAGNADYVAMCAASLAELFEGEKEFDLAATELESAIMYERDPEGQAQLLTRMLRVHLLAEDSKKAEQTFEKARRLAESHRLVSSIVDIHVIAADFAWEKGNRASRVDALKGYLAAIAYGVIGNAPDCVSNAETHVVLRLTNVNLAPALGEFASMLDDARQCLPSKILSAKPIMRVVMWPFEVIQAVLPFVGDKRRFPVELQRALERGRDNGREIRES